MNIKPRQNNKVVIRKNKTLYLAKYTSIKKKQLKIIMNISVTNSI